MRTTREQAEELIEKLLDSMESEYPRIPVETWYDLIESALRQPRPWSDGDWMHFHTGCWKEAKSLIGKKVVFYNNFIDFNPLFKRLPLYNCSRIRGFTYLRIETEIDYSYIAIPISEIEKEQQNA